MTLLLDYYGELLTEKQKTCFDLYYNQDLSLGEIAEEAGISRQGVHDTLSKAEQALLDFEQKLGCVARENRLQQLLQTISAAAQELEGTPQAERILDAVRKIKE
ncbi:MAG: YlxM family DNA-binding protein [Oscillospiraceae bacterium]|nr:YlxM family DNA-binding protein [Oscillospiraceae bacterium]